MRDFSSGDPVNWLTLRAGRVNGVSSLVTLRILIARNLRTFLRDHMTVFFSLTAPLILFVLFVVFFRENNAKLIADAIGGGAKSDAYAVCDAWLFGSIGTLATFSSSLGLLTSFVDDRVTGRFADYLVSPVRRWQLALGYVMSSVIVSVVLSSLLVLLGQVWARTQGQAFMSTMQDLRMLMAIVVACVFFASFNTLIVTYTATTGAFGGYSIIMGTAMGFLSFCYTPPSTLSSNINSFLSAWPFAQTAALIRAPVMEPAISRLTDQISDAGLRDTASQTIADNLGMHLTVSGHSLSPALMVGMILALTVVLALLSAWRMGRVIR